MASSSLVRLSSLVTALVVSLLLHGALVLTACARMATPRNHDPVAPALPDVWSGTSVEVAWDTPAEASPPDESPAEKAPASSPPAEKAPEKGEGLAPPHAPAPRAPPPPRRLSARQGVPAAPSLARLEASGTSLPGTFGAVGPTKLRDLRRAFARAVGPACQADPAWSRLAVGDAGQLDVTVFLDDAGHVREVTPLGLHPPAILLELAQRTTAMLHGSTFALRAGKVTAGRHVLRLHARLDTSPDQGVRGGLAEVGFGEEGSLAYGTFTQSSGRRVKVTVQTVRVEPGGLVPDREVTPRDAPRAGLAEGREGCFPPANRP